MTSPAEPRPRTVAIDAPAPRLLHVERTVSGAVVGYAVEYLAGAELPADVAQLPRYGVERGPVGHTGWLTGLFLALFALIVGVWFASGVIGWPGLLAAIAGGVAMVAGVRGMRPWRHVPSDGGRVVIFDHLPEDVALPLTHRASKWWSRVPVDLQIGVLGFLCVAKGIATAWAPIYAGFAVAGVLQLLAGQKAGDATLSAAAAERAPRRWLRRAANVLSLVTAAAAGALTIYNFEQLLPRWLTGAVVAVLMIRAVRNLLRGEGGPPAPEAA